MMKKIEWNRLDMKIIGLYGLIFMAISYHVTFIQLCVDKDFEVQNKKNDLFHLNG